MFAAPTDDNFAALKTMPYTFEVALPPDVRLPIDHCTEILENSAAYPRVWVLAAERIASTAGGDPALEDVAVGSGWFAE